MKTSLLTTVIYKTTTRSNNQLVAAHSDIILNNMPITVHFINTAILFETAQMIYEVKTKLHK